MKQPNNQQTIIQQTKHSLYKSDKKQTSSLPTNPPNRPANQPSTSQPTINQPTI